MTDENKTERLHMLISPSELKAIDDWGFKNRIRTKAEAVRRLCEIGLVYDRELGMSREHCRTAMNHSLAGLRRMMAFLDRFEFDEDDAQLELLEMSGDFIKSGHALAALFQDMAATDSTATVMEEAGELTDLLQKAADVRAGIDARRRK